MKPVSATWALLAIFALTSVMRSQNSREGSAKHNFNGQGCTLCHAPPTPSGAASPEESSCEKMRLWDCELLSRTFHRYDEPILHDRPGSDLRMDDMDVRLASIQCVSCHDGAATPTMSGVPGFNATGDSSPATGFQGGHPVNVRHDPARNATLAPLGIVSEKLKLFGPTKTVQCSTCHDVHNSTNTKFLLRTPNQDSALCILCHQ